MSPPGNNMGGSGLPICERLRAAQETRTAFERAREAMNAAIPHPVNATPAERALYDERYRADHKAERAHLSAALQLFANGHAAEAAEVIWALYEAVSSALPYVERVARGEGTAAEVVVATATVEAMLAILAKARGEQ